MSSIKKLALFFIASLMVSTSVHANESYVKKLGDNVYAVSMFNYTSLVVVGDKGVLVTDTANSYRAKVLKAEVAKLTDKPVTKIVLSHEHFDHVGGTEVFPDAEIIAQRNILEYENLDPLNMVPDEIHTTFNKSMTIDMGTTSLELLHFGAADGLAVAVVYLPEEKIALTADMYIDSGLSPGVFLTDTNMLGNRLLLNNLADWDLAYAINVHSRRVDLEPLMKTRDFYNDLYDLVLGEVQKQMNEDPSGLVRRTLEMSETLQMPEYQSWENYQDLPIYIRKMSFSIIHGG
ncbi:MBL fold metallo-hydrolase [Vibrio fortis]|uniref:MBL fold metallo-hydrolase n=1 Tax=Vibrio fortis TaxID=212667 RepID=UPI0038CD66A5